MTLGPIDTTLSKLLDALDHEPARIANQAGVRTRIARLAQEYHAARCREAMGEGPVSEARAGEILAGSCPDTSWEQDACDARLLSIHLAARALELEGRLHDYMQDSDRLVEEGRRLERAEIIARVGKVLDVAQGRAKGSRQYFPYAEAVANVLAYLQSRGPAPGPMPAADALRARVKELEAEVARLNAAIDSLPQSQIDDVADWLAEHPEVTP